MHVTLQMETYQWLLISCHQSSTTLKVLIVPHRNHHQPKYDTVVDITMLTTIWLSICWSGCLKIRDSNTTYYTRCNPYAQGWMSICELQWGPWAIGKHNPESLKSLQLVSLMRHPFAKEREVRKWYGGETTKVDSKEFLKSLWFCRWVQWDVPSQRRGRWGSDLGEEVTGGRDSNLEATN